MKQASNNNSESDEQSDVSSSNELEETEEEEQIETEYMKILIMNTKVFFNLILLDLVNMNMSISKVITFVIILL